MFFNKKKEEPKDKLVGEDEALLEESFNDPEAKDEKVEDPFKSLNKELKQIEKEISQTESSLKKIDKNIQKVNKKAKA